MKKERREEEKRGEERRGEGRRKGGGEEERILGEPFFFISVLLRCNSYTALFKFKMYS